MAVPGVILLIPKFLVLNYLGIYNACPALVLPLLVDAAGALIMRQLFKTIPEWVEEAARIDGAGTFRIFWSVVLPMARPALITLTILSFQITMAAALLMTIPVAVMFFVFQKYSVRGGTAGAERG